MILSVAIILVIMNSVNVLLHGTGIYLLNVLHRKGKSNIQNIYILHLSVSELLMNSLEIIRTSLLLLIEYKISPNVCQQLEHYLSIVMFTGISFVFYLTMVFITIDRLLNIVLVIRYRVYWSERKAKLLLRGTWISGAFMLACISCAYYISEYDWENLFYKMFYPSLEFIFIALALVTYILIFRKYNNSERVLLARRKSVRNNKKPDSSFQVFRKSRFFVPVLLILTFLLFMVIPDMIILFIGVVMNQMSDILLTSCWISYAVSNMTDACIYIFMQDTVRDLFIKKTRRLLRYCYGNKYGGRKRVRRKCVTLGPTISTAHSRFLSDESTESQQTILSLYHPSLSSTSRIKKLSTHGSCSPAFWNKNMSSRDSGDVTIYRPSCSSAFRNKKLSSHGSDDVFMSQQRLTTIRSSSSSSSFKGETTAKDKTQQKVTAKSSTDSQNIRFAMSIEMNIIGMDTFNCNSETEEMGSSVFLTNEEESGLSSGSVFYDPKFTSDLIFM